MQTDSSRGYLLAAILGGIGGALAVTLFTRSVPTMMARMREECPCAEQESPCSDQGKAAEAEEGRGQAACSA